MTKLLLKCEFTPNLSSILKGLHVGRVKIHLLTCAHAISTPTNMHTTNGGLPALPPVHHMSPWPGLCAHCCRAACTLSWTWQRGSLLPQRHASSQCSFLGCQQITKCKFTISPTQHSLSFPISFFSTAPNTSYCITYVVLSYKYAWHIKMLKNIWMNSKVMQIMSAWYPNKFSRSVPHYKHAFSFTCR